MDGLTQDQIISEYRGQLLFSAGLEPNLASALRQVLDTPGSMVRPQIVLKVGLAYGLDTAAASQLAIALEYFHTASLVFDDLPCMDNAAQRRGAPCLHLIYGEAGAILAALGLINRAYALVWASIAACSANHQQPGHAFLEEHLGIQGLLNGQSLDLNFSNQVRARKVTEQIALYKTVSLIKLALVLPALLGGAPPRESSLLNRIAVFWGLAYQTLDDLKDLLQSEGQAGKTVARDHYLGRPNIALAIGIPAAADRLARMVELGSVSLQKLMAMKPEMSFLEKLCSELREEAGRMRESARQSQMAAGT